MDDRHAPGAWAPAAPISGTPHSEWPQNPLWEVPYQPYGHAENAETDLLFGAWEGAYGSGAPDHHPFAYHVGQYENSGHDTAQSWDSRAIETDSNGQWHEGHWVDHTGQVSYQTSPDSSDEFGVKNAADLVEPGFTPGRSLADQTPPHDDPTSRHNWSEARSASSAPPDQPRTRRPGGRGRRAPRRGAAFLTVVAPSVAFVGMAGIAAASIGLGGSGRTTQATPEPAVEPSAANNEFDTQLSTLSREADDFADRASRTQQRVDLEQQRLEEQKLRQAEAARKREEAALKEALRPKFVLPVTRKGVGELFGAVGSMWSSRHTGLDFPVPMYTPVMAVTDGTVVAKRNPSYGNIIEVTAPDGTQTWYAHLASTRIRSGHVKAGTVIGYAGSSGNSSGPHLHLEVHLSGGAAVDPLS